MPEDMRQELLRWLAVVDPAFVGVGLLSGLPVVDAGLLILGIRRFRRTRLTLD